MTVRQPSLSARSPRLCPNSAQAQRPLRLSVILSLPPLCFHGLTNPFSRNPFTFTSIQNPGGCGVKGSPQFPPTLYPRTSQQQLDAKFFPCHTSQECPPNSFRCHTYKI